MKYPHFRNAASSVFPTVKWTGGGAIHASVALQSELPVPPRASREIMHVMLQANFPGMIMNKLLHLFPGVEWLLSPEEFSTLVLVDFHRMLRGQGAVATEKRLRNPVTNNVFHRIALKPDAEFVGGIRFWATPAIDRKTLVGFRFRLQELIGEPARQQVREHIRAQIEALEAEMIDIKEYAATLPEATKVKLTNYEQF